MEEFTPEERRTLARHFTDLSGPVFALVNLPEAVKGALFARYSRSGKSLRRLFLDEFDEGPGAAEGGPTAGAGRASELYTKVFFEYGDDSVAQLGGVHLSCEGVSNVLTKVLERGRLMSYLEQSTRYVPWTDRPGGRYKYVVPPEVGADGPLRARYEAALDACFDTYCDLLPRMERHFAGRFPPAPGDSPAAHRRTVRAKALDAVRGLLPAAARSNVGLYGSGQAYEALLLRLRGSPLAEAREVGARMLNELRKVIPDFVRRVDVPDRGGAWTAYLTACRRAMAEEAARLPAPAPAAEPGPAVVLTEFDPEGEAKVAAAALYPVSRISDADLLARVRDLPAEERRRILLACAGDRTNRRHRPGRAFERTSYRFDILADYGAFRDLQRHRILSIDWQPLSPAHGFVVPPEIEEAGASAPYHAAMEASAGLFDALAAAGRPEVAPYAVCMAYRIRFYLHLNAREAMHVIELRTTPQGHPSYRKVCQEMHRLIREEAGHGAIADAMRFADHSGGDAGRGAAEQAAERRRPSA